MVMAKSKGSKHKPGAGTPEIHNRKARHTYRIESTLECGLQLYGSEVKAVREGKVSLGEGYAKVDERTGELWLHDIHIGEYGPARGSANVHEAYRKRKLLVQKREIRKLAISTRTSGVTLVPLKLYFVRGWAKLLIGVAHGKRKADRREDNKKRDAQRDMDRAMTRKTIR